MWIQEQSAIFQESSGGATGDSMQVPGRSGESFQEPSVGGDSRLPDGRDEAFRAPPGASKCGKILVGPSIVLPT
jgi:hypothetical protein